MEARLRQLEGRALAATPGTKGRAEGNGDAPRYDPESASKRQYNADADVVMAGVGEKEKGKKKKKKEEEEEEEEEEKEEGKRRS